MFTGIVEYLGKVKSIEKSSGFAKIVISGYPVDKLTIGASVAVNGVCLTAVTLDASSDTFRADVSFETLKLTSIGDLKVGGPVNLEGPLTLNKPLGGHMVTGHVDALGEVIGLDHDGENVDLHVAVPEDLRRQLIKKGSVCVDGISLTVAEVTDRGFRVAIIPHTMEVTTLGASRVGTKVNIETDIIGKYVERFMTSYGLENSKSNITEALLRENGFIK